MIICVSCIIVYQVFSLLNKSAFSRRIYRILLCYYIIVVLMLTLGTRTASSDTNINLNPLITMFTVTQSCLQGLYTGGFVEMINRIGWYIDPIIKSELNVILFIPLGILVCLCCSTYLCTWKIVLIGLCFSLMIEITQWSFQLGWLDTADLIQNMIGTLLGFYIYKRLFPINLKTIE